MSEEINNNERDEIRQRAEAFWAASEPELCEEAASILGMKSGEKINRAIIEEPRKRFIEELAPNTPQEQWKSAAKAAIREKLTVDLNAVLTRLTAIVEPKRKKFEWWAIGLGVLEANAPDKVQDALLRAARSLVNGTGEGKEGLRSYFTNTLRSVCMDHHRTDKESLSETGSAHEGEDRGGEEIASSESNVEQRLANDPVAVLEAAVHDGKMSPMSYRILSTLYLEEGSEDKSRKDFAKELGTCVRTLHRWTEKAKAEARAVLKDYNF